MDMLQWLREDTDWLYDENDPVGSLAYRVSFHLPICSTAPWPTSPSRPGRRSSIPSPTGHLLQHRRLRHGGGSERISKDMVEHEFGIPWITVDVDVLDKRFIAKEKDRGQVGGVLRDCREQQAIPKRGGKRNEKPTRHTERRGNQYEQPI